MGRAPLVESTSTSLQRSTSPAAQRATSDVEATCLTSWESIRQRTAVEPQMMADDVVRSARLQHGRAQTCSENEHARSRCERATWAAHLPAPAMCFCLAGKRAFGLAAGLALPAAPHCGHWTAAARDGQLESLAWCGDRAAPRRRRRSRPSRPQGSRAF